MLLDIKDIVIVTYKTQAEEQGFLILWMGSQLLFSILLHVQYALELSYKGYWFYARREFQAFWGLQMSLADEIFFGKAVTLPLHLLHASLRTSV